MTETKETKTQKVETKKIAIILVRGLIGITVDIKDTLYLLRMRKKHTCVVVENTPSNVGMINKVKDYVTYGEIDNVVLKELISKRGKPNHKAEGKTKPFFELAPPRGGFERKGIKKAFRQGGVLGYRGNKINDLLKRMI